MNERDEPVGRSAEIVPLSPRGRPRTRPWAITVVLLVAVAGLALVSVGAFRAGTLTIAASAWLGMALRLTLSDRQAGLLVVRHRAVDVGTLVALGVAATVLALWVPVPR